MSPTLTNRYTPNVGYWVSNSEFYLSLIQHLSGCFIEIVLQRGGGLRGPMFQPSGTFRTRQPVWIGKP